MTSATCADLLIRWVLARLLATDEAHFGIEQTLAVSISFAVDVLCAPEATVSDGGRLLCRHSGVATLERFLGGLCGRRGRWSEVLDQRLR